MKAKLFLAAIALAVIMGGWVLSSPAEAQVASGSYVGNGTSQSISGLGFQPDVVIVKGNVAQTAVIRTSTMAGDATKPIAAATGLTAGLIQSLDADGFTVGSGSRVNQSGINYYWVAFKATGGELAVGSYGGTGATQSIAVGFQPNYVIVMSGGANQVVHTSSAMTAGESMEFAATSAVTLVITALQATGFQVGTDARANAAGTNYHYVAWKTVTGKMNVGVYTGNAVDNRNITGVGFQPAYVIVKRRSTTQGVHHPASLGVSVDNTLTFPAAVNTGANRIQGLLADGFQVGTVAAVNSSLDYFWAAFGVQCSAVADAAYVAANAQSGQAILYWSSSNPALILRKTGAAFAGEAPANGTIYAVNSQIGGATVVYNGAAASSFTEGSLTNATTYYYKVFPKTTTGGTMCYAPGIEVNARPEAGPTPDWSYMMAGGAVLKAGIAGLNGTIYSSSNANRIISLSTTNPKGTPSWAPLATNAAVQGWLTWASVGSGGIKSVQSGTWTTGATTENLGAAQGFAGVTDVTKSVVVCSQLTDSSNDTRRVACHLTNATTLTLTTEQTGSVVRWYVAEFKGGVSVQRGTETFATTDGTRNVPLTAVDLTKSFVLISEMTSDPSWSQLIDEQWTTRARLTSATNLELSRNATGIDLSVAWQVVQMSAATVRRDTGTTCIGPVASCPGSDGATTTVTLTPAVTLGQSFLVFSRRASAASGGVEGEFQVTGEITGGGSSLTFTRALNSANIVDIAWEVVSLGDGTTVKRGTVNSGLSDTPLNATLSPAVTRSRSIPLVSARGSVGAGATADLDSASWTATFTNSDLVTPCSGATCPNLQMQRVSSLDVDATVAWQVVEFATTGGAPVVWGGDQSGRAYSVDPGLGIINWTVNLTSQGIDGVQAGISAQVKTWSNSAFQNASCPSDGAPFEDLLFVASRNSATADPNKDNKVFALRASDGVQCWTFQDAVNGVHYIVGMPAVDYARNLLYVASRAGASGTQPSLWVLSTLDGSVVTSFALGHLDTSPSPSYDGNTLYVATTAGQLYAIDLTPATPALKWTGPMALGSAINGFVWEDGALATYLYFSTADGNVWCIRDPGVSQPPPSTPPLSPQASCPWKNLVNGTGVSNLLPLDPPYAGLYVGGADGTLRRLNPASGVIETTVTVGDGTKIVGDLSTETGSEVFVPTSEGKIYKFPLPLP